MTLLFLIGLLLAYFYPIKKKPRDNEDDETDNAENK